MICLGFLQRSQPARTLTFKSAFRVGYFLVRLRFARAKRAIYTGTRDGYSVVRRLAFAFQREIFLPPTIRLFLNPLCDTAPKNRSTEQFPQTDFNLENSVVDGLRGAVIAFRMGDLGHGHPLTEELVYEGLLGGG